MIQDAKLACIKGCICDLRHSILHNIIRKPLITVNTVLLFMKDCNNIEVKVEVKVEINVEAWTLFSYS